MMNDIPIEPLEVIVILDGQEFHVAVAPGKTILEAALDAGLPAPFSCQAGICATCRAKCHAGKISMDCHDALSDDEVEDGYVLTCQSHPLTHDVKVEYE